MKALYLESVAGVAGDMFAASFVDAGLVSAEELQALPARLGLDGVRVKISSVIKATMRATHIDVDWENEGWKKVFSLGAPHSHPHGAVAAVAAGGAKHAHSHEGGHWHTHYRDLDRFLEKSALEVPTKAFARKVFRNIAVAEADAHGMSIDDVSFHEVGAVDSIIDVVMAAYCVAKVGAARVYATPVKLGRGTITIDHGTHAVPPPASARLSVDMPVGELPPAIARANVELSTPTGLAILKTLAPEFRDSLPRSVIKAQGMGAGTMDLGSYPNVFRVSLLEENAGMELPYEADQVVEISCNMDDETAERTAWVMERLMKLGALDVWATPVTGKKGRPAVMLSVLAEATSWSSLADWLLRNSSTFGLRYTTWDRLKLARRFEKRSTSQGELTYKIGSTTAGEVLKEKPEFEELRRAWDKQTE